MRRELDGAGSGVSTPHTGAAEYGAPCATGGEASPRRSGTSRLAGGEEPRGGDARERRRDPSAGHFVVRFLLFGTLVGIALLLLLTALVVWLSDLMGSFIAATLLLGGCFALLASGIYLFSIREAVEQIRNRAETVYEVARIARSGYEWVSQKASFLIDLYNILRKE